MNRLHQRQIEAFRAVMLAGSVNAAAAHMHVTQPAVSRLIRDLELAIGFALFDRQRGRLVPRPEASQLFREVERVFVGLEHIARVAQDIHAVSEGVIRIGAVSSVNAICVNDVLPAVLAEYAKLRVIFDTESTERVLDLVSLRHYDFGVICSDFDRSGLDNIVLGTGNAVAVMEPGHPKASARQLALSDLAEERVILPGRTSPVRMSLETELQASGIDLRYPIEASLSNACLLAAQGSGVAVVDPLVAADCPVQVSIVSLEPAIPVSYRLVRPPGVRPIGPLAAFESALKMRVRDRLKDQNL